MKDDTRENSRPRNYFRYALLSFTAFLVLSLGFALIPREAPAPAVPPFSEQARASALAETMRLRAASHELAEGASGAQRQLFSRTVTLLTTQARALVLPAEKGPGGAPDPSSPGSATGSATGSAAATAAPVTVPALVAGLSASGKQRLVQAEKADGGMARLLAAVGTAQLLQARALAQASGTPVPALPAAPAPQRTAADSCPVPASPSAAAPGDAGAASAKPGSASQADALNRVVRTEVETVYGYQVALTRLEGPAAEQASSLLAVHEALVDEAEAYSRVHCAPIPPRDPGYTLGTSFLQKPAAGLASLEAGTLPVYGDLVALSDGATRRWAIASLLTAAQRSIRWGSDPGPVPGIVLDTTLLPALPEG
ncbi:hypothetical protein ASG92_05325 [Arthrobacter sp. Soil736]|uniref:ferritin-like domain-containing protein n=1 Tax=Arthrobacter sp. Soil736 TaxID=1736395 RepID=UPI0006F74DA2|nr:ferritin-like domain-containing protein [Arthrobacter sp. Soil736]KRE59261.1 hypothetical protein ASG92_05325 [Arthrobacter sp. Soil736]